MPTLITKLPDKKYYRFKGKSNTGKYIWEDLHSHLIGIRSELENPWGQLVRLKIGVSKSKSDHGSASFADRAVYASKLSITAFPVTELSEGIPKKPLIREVYKAKFAYGFDPVDWFVCLPSEGKPNYWLAYYVPLC